MMHSTRHHEYKFTEVTRFNLQQYVDLVNLYFSYPDLQFHSLLLNRSDPAYSLSKWGGDEWSAYAHLTRELLERRIDRDVFAIVDLQDKPDKSPVYLGGHPMFGWDSKGLPAGDVRHVHIPSACGRVAGMRAVRLEGLKRLLQCRIQAGEGEKGIGQLCEKPTWHWARRVATGRRGIFPGVGGALSIHGLPRGVEWVE